MKNWSGILYINKHFLHQRSLQKDNVFGFEYRSACQKALAYLGQIEVFKQIIFIVQTQKQLWNKTLLLADATYILV